MNGGEKGRSKATKESPPKCTFTLRESCSRRLVVLSLEAAAAFSKPVHRACFRACLHRGSSSSSLILCNNKKSDKESLLWLLLWERQRQQRFFFLLALLLPSKHTCFRVAVEVAPRVCHSLKWSRTVEEGTSSPIESFCIWGYSNLRPTKSFWFTINLHHNQYYWEKAENQLQYHHPKQVSFIKNNALDPAFNSSREPVQRASKRR